MRTPSLILAVLCASRLASPQHVGARAAAMGGAFTGVADDATAFYWNPAGIAFGRFLSAGVYHGNAESTRGDRLYEDGATGFSLEYTFMGLALTQFRESVVDATGVESGLDTFDVAVSVLQSLPPDNLVVAANLHYLSGNAYEIDTDAGVSSRSWDVDVGVLYEPTLDMRFGVMLSRLREARFETTDGGERRLSRHARAGASFRLPADVMVAADFDLSTRARGDDEFREASFGVEKALWDRRVFARAGVRAETGSGAGSRPAFSFGAGAQVWILELEAAYQGSSEDRHDAYWFGATLTR